MEEKKNKGKAPCVSAAAESERMAYMIAWRDRHIERLQEIVEGYEQECALLEALLCFALQKAASEQEEGSRVLEIPKAELKALLGKWECSTKNGESFYTLTFTPKKEEEDAAPCAEE